MLRVSCVPPAGLLLIAVAPATAAPAQRQPTPAIVKSEAVAEAGMMNASRQLDLKAEEAQMAAEARSKVWDAKTAEAMKGVCQGC